MTKVQCRSELNPTNKPHTSPSQVSYGVSILSTLRNDVIKWKHFPRYWPFVGGIHRSPVNSPHKGQWHEALMFSLICFWITGWVNNHEAGDLRRYHAHYDVSAMVKNWPCYNRTQLYYYFYNSRNVSLRTGPIDFGISAVKHGCVVLW